MKKLLLIIVMFTSTLLVEAQTWRAYSLSVRSLENGTWTSWVTQGVDIEVTLDLNREELWIFSENVQKYTIIKKFNQYYDYTDGIKSEIFEYGVVDNNNVRATFVARCGDDFVQIYIKYADLEIMYQL